MSDQGRYGHAGHGRTGTARRHLQLTLPTCGQPVRLARQVTREVLAAWQLAHVQETAGPLVSELVANAVRDAASTSAITLELQVVHTWLRIEAYRCRPGRPCRAPRLSPARRVPGWPWWIAWPASGGGLPGQHAGSGVRP